MAVIDKYWISHNSGYKKFNDYKVYAREKEVNFYITKYIDKQVNYYYVWALKTIN